jgi:hypothetical protein
MERYSLSIFEIVGIDKRLFLEVATFTMRHFEGGSQTMRPVGAMFPTMTHSSEPVPRTK